jgi:hypothetical protein
MIGWRDAAKIDADTDRPPLACKKSIDGWLRQLLHQDVL